MSKQLVSRRDVTKWLALAGALSACGRAPALESTPAPRARRRLSRVNVDANRVIREVTGLRPFRRNGFRVDVESLGDKTVIHNYGHGGGGVSLSWGTAQLALERALQMPHRRCAVIGCGAVGLATARLLQDRGFAVTIYTRDLPPNTTSNIAGAQWMPTTVVDNDRRTATFDAQYVAASRFAFRHFQLLVQPRYGVTWRESYFLSQDPRRQPVGERALIDELLQLVDLQPSEHPFTGLHAARMLTMHIEPSIYMLALLADFRAAGGRVVVHDFPSAQSLGQVTEPVLVNCTGLGAATLFDDSEMLPIKGQLLVLIPQAEIDYITIGPGPGGLYMMPRHDGIILGGTFERGVATLEPDAQHSQRILESHRALFNTMS
ncbi:MAG: FAD-dependent oxidoreductase [Gemmatimonadaceae bacterium]